MTASEKRARTPEARGFLDALDEVSEAVESGAGLPAVARAAGRALDASVIVLDASSRVLAVACASPDDERAVMAGQSGSALLKLRVADAPVGQLRLRPRGEPPDSSLLRLVTNLIALEVDRARAPERATEAAVGDFLSDLLERRVTDRENIVARAEELGCDPRGGARLTRGADRDRRAASQRLWPGARDRGAGRAGRPGGGGRPPRARGRTRQLHVHGGAEEA